MNRKQFVKTCGLACIGTSTLGLLLQSCAGPKMIQAAIEGDRIKIPLQEFEVVKNKQKTFRKYLVVENEQLQFPICLYRHAENEYTALYLRCTHQGNELTPYGDKLHCSAHGSEFDTLGNVSNGPAEKSLKKFPVTQDEKNLLISLKVS